MLEKIHVGKKTQPPRILVYGIEGIGKSTYAATFPKAIFVPCEDGIDNIACSSFPVCRTFDEVIAYLDSLINEPHEYRTVVIDSVTALQRLIFDKVVHDQFGADGLAVKKKSIEDIGYAKGYVFALTYWDQILNRLQALRTTKRMIPLLLGHCEIKKIENPEVTAFDQFLPNLHAKASEKLRQWCDLVLFATREFGAAKGKTGGGERILRCVHSPMAIAKSRWPLPETLPMTWGALSAALYPKKPATVNRVTDEQIDLHVVNYAKQALAESKI